MIKRQVALVWAACLVALAAGCKGRAGRGEVDAGKPDGSEMEAHLPPMQLIPPIYFSVIGQVDANRYPFLVMIGASPPLDGSTHELICNGVLFASNLVLTAAHCVCAASGGEAIRYDGSQCAAKAEVRVDSPPPNERKSATMEFINGSVLVHPLFQMTLDAQGTVVTSRADLAIIRLERPAMPSIRPARVATIDVQTGEVLSVVGYGHAENPGVLFHRYFSQEKVRTSAVDDRLFFRSMDEAAYQGDMGGPCLRETVDGSELVGISQRGLGLRPACTNIAPYREWLEKQIQLGDERH